MGLSKANRLKHWKAFRAVYSQGKRFKSSNLVLLVLSAAKVLGNQISCPLQVGIAVSQKVSKKAVVRNRIKRQIRAAIRTLLPALIPGYLCVIVVCPQASECNYEHFLRELKQLFVKAEIVYGHTRECIL